MPPNRPCHGAPVTIIEKFCFTFIEDISRQYVSCRARGYVQLLHAYFGKSLQFDYFRSSDTYNTGLPAGATKHLNHSRHAPIWLNMLPSLRRLFFIVLYQLILLINNRWLGFKNTHMQFSILHYRFHRRVFYWDCCTC